MGYKRLQTVFLSTVFSLLTIVLVTSCKWQKTPQKPFDTSTWHTKPDSRVEMIDDMLNRKILNKKTYAEVKDLLGENDVYPFPNNKRDTFPDNENYKRISYKLGGQRDGGIDYEWLDIIFKNDTVVKYINWHD